MRRHGGEPHEVTGGLLSGPPAAAPLEVHVELCRCGCVPEREEPEWALATAWRWLTRPVEEEPAADAADDEHDRPADVVLEEPVDAASLPWWDARASAGRRRSVLPLVLLGELQAGVLLRAVWEVVQGRSAGGA